MYNYVYFTRYPTELERAVEAHLQALKNTEDMTEGDAGIVSEEGSLWTMDLVSLALTGVKSQVHVTPLPSLQAHVTSLLSPRPIGAYNFTASRPPSIKWLWGSEDGVYMENHSLVDRDGDIF